MARLLSPPDSSVADEMASFTRHLRAENKAPSTVVTYGKAVVQFDAFLERSGLPRGVGEVRREHVEACLVDLQARGARPVTVTRRFRSLQQFWKRSAGMRTLARDRRGSAGRNAGHIWVTRARLAPGTSIARLALPQRRRSRVTHRGAARVRYPDELATVSALRPVRGPRDAGPASSPAHVPGADCPGAPRRQSTVPRSPRPSRAACRRRRVWIRRVRADKCPFRSVLR